MNPALATMLAADGALTATILHNVRVELNTVQVETAERLGGRFSPTQDAKVALRGVERLAVALEALAMLIEVKNDAS